jgi:MFS family permease
MRLLISFAALFLSVVLLQLSSGALGPLDALTGLSLGFTNANVGLLGSAHFFGFFIGCWWAPRLMGSIGHSRAFAAFTALGAVGLLSHTLIIHPTGWALMRVASGLCIAGSYTVVEAWLQAKVTNETRGRTMGVYRIVDMGGSLCAQLMIGFLAQVEFYVAYNLLTLLCCASLLPLVLTRVPQPETPSAPRLRPNLALSRSPLAVVSVVVAGLTGAAFRMVGPIYGQEVGLAPDQIGLFLASFVAGGALAQYPAGWLADKYDRRWVLIWFSLASLFSSAVTIATSTTGTIGVMLAAGFFGAMTFPIYSVAAAHAHDFAEDDERVELSAALMFFFALGAIASPFVTSRLIEMYGSAALFYFIATAHLALAIFGFSRMRARPTRTDRTAYAYVPRTSFTIGRLIRRGKSKTNQR